jgi:hypothetical protein
MAAGTALYDEVRHAHHRHVYLGHDPGVCLLNFTACVETLLGRPVQGTRIADEGIVLARRLDHAPSLANALWRKCEVATFCGDTASVTPAVEELLSLADAHGLPMPRAHALAYRGWALCRLGETEEGIARLEEGHEMLARMGASINLSVAFGLFSESLLFTR